MRRWVLGIVLALLLGGAAGLTIADLINRPRDVWAVITFASGTLVGWAWDHRGRDDANRKP